MTSERLGWFDFFELWTLGLGLAMILLSSIVIERNADIKYLWPSWLFKCRTRLRQVIATNQRERRPNKTQEELEKREISVGSLAKLSGDTTAQGVTPLQQDMLVVGQPQISFDLPQNSEHDYLISQMKGEADPGLAQDSALPNKIAIFASGEDVKPFLKSTVCSKRMYLGNPDRCHDACMVKLDKQVYPRSDNCEFFKFTSSNQHGLPKSNTARNPDMLQSKSVEREIYFSLEREGILPDMSLRDFNVSSNACGMPDGSDPDAFNGCPNIAFSLSPSLSFTRHQTTQTDFPGNGLILSSTRGTMTDPFTTDSCVSTHGKPCRLVRHYSTSTTGPFMKKLRRAQRLLVEARKTSRSDQASSAAKWRKVLDRYKQKMQILTGHLAKKDEMMGGTASRITVLRGEIKEALLAVRSSTSTKERLATQCKLNAALMDVIESKSENPTYGADLADSHGSGFKQDQRGLQ